MRKYIKLYCFWELLHEILIDSIYLESNLNSFAHVDSIDLILIHTNGHLIGFLNDFYYIFHSINRSTEN